MKVDVQGVRHEDLRNKLATTPVPNLQKGVSIKYDYPDLPDYKAP